MHISRKSTSTGELPTDTGASTITDNRQFRFDL
jgi:hypothetical protein